MASTINKPHPKEKLLEKSAVKLLLSIAQSDREYGFQNMEAHSSAVDKAIQMINEAIDDLAKVKDKAILAAFGVEAIESDSSESEEDMSESVSLPTEDSEVVAAGKENQIALDDLVPLMRQSSFNWFEFYEKVEALMEAENEVCNYGVLFIKFGRIQSGRDGSNQ